MEGERVLKKMIPLVICIGLIVSLFPQLKQTIAKENIQMITIQSNDVNIREGAGLSYPVISQAKKGDTYALISEQADWFEIKLSNGKVGWVANWLATKNGVTNDNNETSHSQTGIVTTDDLRVRKGPSTSDEVIGYLNRGEKVQISALQNDWAKIDSTFGVGWVSTQFMMIQQQSDMNESERNIGVVTTDILNVRLAPSTDAEVIGKLQANDEVTIVAEEADWFEIVFGQASGWIHNQYVQITSINQTEVENNQNEIPKDLQGKIGTVTGSSLNVRKKNSLKSKVVGTVSAGQHFKIVEEDNRWAKIEYKRGKFGWVAGWFLEITESPGQETVEEKKVKNSYATILHNETNLRQAPDIQSPVVQRANKGEQFKIINKHHDWYEIKLKGNSTAFVAGWIVATSGTVSKVDKPGPERYLKNKTIVIDPGHGGRDNGTTGALGTIEKQLTLKTAERVADKLQAAGAHVILTRTNDTYVSLPARTSISNYHQTDAFISIHYDSIHDSSVRGMTSYYYYDFQKPLADTVHSEVIASTKLKRRETRHGDYYVLRENLKNATLLELGYLSNPAEEAFILTTQFQESVANGVYNGLARHFK